MEQQQTGYIDRTARIQPYLSRLSPCSIIWAAGKLGLVCRTKVLYDPSSITSSPAPRLGWSAASHCIAYAVASHLSRHLRAGSAQPDRHLFHSILMHCTRPAKKPAKLHGVLRLHCPSIYCFSPHPSISAIDPQPAPTPTWIFRYTGLVLYLVPGLDEWQTL